MCYLQSRFMVPMRAKKRMGALSMNLDIGARLCAQHQPQHAGNIQSAAAGSWTTAALQEIRPGSWSQCMRKKTERGLSMNRCSASRQAMRQVREQLLFARDDAVEFVYARFQFGVIDLLQELLRTGDDQQ